MASKSLAELCSICYTETPKYRCPRCQTQTCSLPCYKRHQQRASCNGQRNPAAYVKKSHWATPAGIDHDYNYLKGLERSIEHAGQDTRDRGIGVSVRARTRDAPSERGENLALNKHNANVARAWRPGSALQLYLAENEIDVVKAPIGMARQKANSTRVTNGKKVIWSLEWVEADGRRELDHEGEATMAVKDLWKMVEKRRENAERRRRAAEREEISGDLERGNKRKRSSDESVHATGVPDEEPHDDASARSKGPTTEANVSSNSVDDSDHHPGTQADSILDLGTDPITTQDTSAPPTDSTQAAQQQKKPHLHFYLLKPSTPSTSKVLIPLAANDTLTANLRGRTVLEHPTIYALPGSPDNLPETFQLERDYLKARRAEDQELEGMVKQTQASSSFGGSHEVKGQQSSVSRAKIEAEQPLDQNAILDMLRRDMRS